MFGDPITSYVLDRPLPFGRKLAEKLSLNIKFPTDHTETQAIANAIHPWRELTDQDVKVLLEEIKLEKSRFRIQLLRSTEEVAETLEKDIEDHLEHNPHLIGKGLKPPQRQVSISGGRIDLLFKDEAGNLIVVEVKQNRIGQDALRQIHSYMGELRKQEQVRGTLNKVSGVIVCSGVMPAYENDLRKQTKVRILVYGWELNVKDWPENKPHDDS